MFSSPKTSIAGIGLILTALGTALTALFDADTATNVDWTVTIGMILAGIGLITAKDAVPPPPPTA